MARRPAASVARRIPWGEEIVPQQGVPCGGTAYYHPHPRPSSLMMTMNTSLSSSFVHLTASLTQPHPSPPLFSSRKVTLHFLSACRCIFGQASSSVCRSVGGRSAASSRSKKRGSAFQRRDNAAREKMLSRSRSARSARTARSTTTWRGEGGAYVYIYIYLSICIYTYICICICIYI